MVSAATRKRRVASYIGAGIIPGQGGGVVPILAALGNRNQVPTQVTTGAETQTQVAKYSKNTSGVAFTRPRLRCSNFVRSTSGTEVNGPNAFTIRASIEYPVGGTRTPFTQNGSRDMVVQPGQTLDFDPIEGLTIPDGAAFRKIFLLIVNSGEHFPRSVVPLLAALGDGMETAFGTVLTDKTLSGSIGAASGGLSYDAVLIGEAEAGGRHILIDGDSISLGIAETSSPFTSDTDGNIGSEARAFGPKASVLSFAAPTTRASQWAVAGAMDKSIAMMSDLTFTDLSIGYGRNDVAGSRTAAQLKADNETIIARYKAARTFNKVWVRDFPPTSSSSDSWATVDNQTRAAGGETIKEASRQTYKGMVSSKSLLGQTDAFSLAAFCEATTSAGAGQPGIVVWPATSTPDGIHGLANVYIGAAAGNVV